MVEAKVPQPIEINDIKTLIKDDKKIITRGLGRSCGDCANNEIITASHNKNTDLFRATCCEMGLTGIIISATLKL